MLYFRFYNKVLKFSKRGEKGNAISGFSILCRLRRQSVCDCVRAAAFIQQKVRRARKESVKRRNCQFVKC